MNTLVFEIMNKVKFYKDSKEFPLLNHERIISTGNFFYMIKGYDDGDDVEGVDVDVEDLKERYNDIVKDYVVSINSKNHEMVLAGRLEAYKLDLMKFSLARDIITLHSVANSLREKEGVPIDNTLIDEMLKDVKIPKDKDLDKQIEIIDRKIAKLQSDIKDVEGKMGKSDVVEGEVDINEVVTNVELILERNIDMEKVSLYRFGIMQEQAMKKIENLRKNG